MAGCLPRGVFILGDGVPKIFTLSSHQRKVFDSQGVLRLPEFYPKADIDLMASRLWGDLEKRYGLRRDRSESWGVASPAHFQALKRSGAFDALGSPILLALADALLGVGHWNRPAHWGAPLVTFPTPVPTFLRPPWHLDIGGVEPLSPLPTQGIFTFLEPVAAHGGGTLYVVGSHRLAMELERQFGGPVRSAQVRNGLASEHQWFERLLAASTAELRTLIAVDTLVGGHAVRLDEMTGASGDLIVMHPAVLHGTAHNALDRPRLMLTEWIRRLEGARK